MRLTRLANVAWRMRRGRPTFVSFNVTNRCTMSCPMCAVWRQDVEELTTAEIADVFGRLRAAGFAVVEISGGEPFLRADLFEILATLDRLGFLYTVNTNGTLLTADSVRRLSKARGLLQLAVSLDSLRHDRFAQLRGTDSLDLVLENLDTIAAVSPALRVKLNVTMSRVNYDEVLGLVDFAEDRGLGISVFPLVRGVGFTHRSDCDIFNADDDERREMAAVFHQLAAMRRKGRPLWEYSEYYDVAAEYVLGHPIGPCGAGRLFYDLRANGDLAACVDLPPFASLRRESVADALARAEGESARIAECSAETPCCYTCTANISTTALHPLRFAAETALARIRPSMRARHKGAR